MGLIKVMLGREEVVVSEPYIIAGVMAVNEVSVDGLRVYPEGSFGYRQKERVEE